MTAPELTREQAETLDLLAEGLTRKEMAKRLFLSHEAARSRVRVLYQQLGAHNAHGAVAIAFRTGLLTLDGPAHREELTYDPPPTADDPHRYALGAGGNRTYPRQETPQ